MYVHVHTIHCTYLCFIHVHVHTHLCTCNLRHLLSLVPIRKSMYTKISLTRNSTNNGHKLYVQQN